MPSPHLPHQKRTRRRRIPKISAVLLRAQQGRQERLNLHQQIQRLDRQTWGKHQPRQRHYRLPGAKLDKKHPEAEVAALRRQPQNLHPPEIHLKASALQKAQIRPETLYDAKLRARPHEGLLVPLRLRPHHFNRVHSQNQQRQRPSHQRRRAEESARLRQIRKGQQNLLLRAGSVHKEAGFCL